MTALDHALAWAQGERMEGAATTVLAFLLVVAAGLLWKFGATAAARAMVAPLLVVGMLIVVTGIALELQNVRRIDALGKAHALDPAAFLEQETARVESFMKWYVYTFFAGSVLIAGGLATFLFASSPTLGGVGSR